MGITQEHKTASEHADIAVIGLACRFPGGASDPQKFWELLSNKRCKIDSLAAEMCSLYADSCFKRHFARSPNHGTTWAPFIMRPERN